MGVKPVQKGRDGAPPLVAAVRMGYGHLRAAAALADALGAELVEVEGSALTPAAERRLWRRMRRLYEGWSRASQLPVVGAPLRWALDRATAIPGPPGPPGSAAASTAATRSLERMVGRGLGAGLGEHLRGAGRGLLTTFYAPALAADGGAASFVLCVVTDTDIHRIWAASDAAAGRVVYLTPTPAAGARLRSYGVRDGCVVETGFPLPPELLGGEGLDTLRSDLGRRLTRLDPVGKARAGDGRVATLEIPIVPPPPGAAPLHLVFAVGGAGAQARRALELVDELHEALARGELRLTLVAGARPDLGRRFAGAVRRHRLSAAVGVLAEPTFAAYVTRFNQLLREADVLWTKPSELVFFAALGLPLLLDDPVGDHERHNRRWLLEHGAALDRPPPGEVARRLRSWRSSGELARVALNGFERLPQHGTHRIAALLGERF